MQSEMLALLCTSRFFNNLEIKLFLIVQAGESDPSCCCCLGREVSCSVLNWSFGRSIGWENLVMIFGGVNDDVDSDKDSPKDKDFKSFLSPKDDEGNESELINVSLIGEDSLVAVKVGEGGVDKFLLICITGAKCFAKNTS